MVRSCKRCDVEAGAARRETGMGGERGGRRPATGHRVANSHLSDGWPPEAEREGRRPQTATADDGSRPVRCHGVAIRLFDILGAATFLAATLPILAGASVAILLNGPGPVLFRQRRVGR